MNGFEDFRGQSAHLAQLERDFAQGRHVHAYLFSGPKGTGKKSVARLCAMAALCRGEKKPCGECGPCRRVLAGTHPDIHEIVPEKGKQQIGVDVVRGVIEEVGVQSFEGGVKVLICPQAEKMNLTAQNCLLKTLEEPPQGTVFFLITDQPGTLLPTIVSRCRTVRFHPLSMEQTKARLMALGETEQNAAIKARMSEGCVGQALEIDESKMNLRRQVTQDVFSVRSAADVMPVLAQYKDDKEKQKQVLTQLETALRDMMIAKGTGAAMESGSVAPQAHAYNENAPLSAHIALMQCVIEAKKMCTSNVAFASALEMVLLKVSEEYAQWRW